MFDRIAGFRPGPHRTGVDRRVEPADRNLERPGALDQCAKTLRQELDALVVTLLAGGQLDLGFFLVGLSEPLAVRLKLAPVVLLAVIGVTISAVSGALLRMPLPHWFSGIERLFADLPLPSEIFIYVFLPLLVFQPPFPYHLMDLPRPGPSLEELAKVRTDLMRVQKVRQKCA